MIKLKPFEQSPGFCGPASLKMVLDYYGAEFSEEELAKVGGANRELGILLQGMVKAARHFGFHVFYKENSALDDIRYFIKRDIPVIVAWFSPFDGSYDGHYSVVTDINKKNIILVDPVFPISGKILTYIIRTRKLLLADFFKLWFDFDGYFIKTQKDLLLRQMLVITPFKEKFPIKAKKIKKGPKIVKNKSENSNSKVETLTNKLTTNN